MSWQEELPGETLAEAVEWFLDHLVEGTVLDHEIFENIDNPWKRQRPDVVRLHRVWAKKRRADNSTVTYCADIEEYDSKDRFFARAIMDIAEGPWGPPPPAEFGRRKEAS